MNDDLPPTTGSRRRDLAERKKSKASNRHNHLRQLITTEMKLKMKASELKKEWTRIRMALAEIRKQLRDF